jgi:hypothetical protein
MSIKERAELFCEHRKIRLAAFCRAADISNGYFTNKREEIGYAICKKITKTFPELNLDWLQTGEGEMLKVPATVTMFNPSAEEAQAAGENIDLSIVPTELVEKIREEVIAEMETSGEVVPIEQPPLVPDKIVRDPNIEVLDWVNDPDNDRSRNAFNFASILRRTKFIIEMDNNAMAPSIYQRDHIFLKPFAEKSEIIDGEIYGIETESHGLLIRFLYDDGDYYLARPKNTREFGDIRIPKIEDGKPAKKYHIVYRGSTHLSSLPDNEGEMTKQLGQQREYISSLIGEVGKAISEVSKSGERVDRLIDMIEKKL